MRIPSLIPSWIINALSSIILIRPDWPAPANIKALSTTRQGGFSSPPYHSFNLASHVGDDKTVVEQNRAELARHMPAQPIWLDQTHTNKVIELGIEPHTISQSESFDASITRVPQLGCVVMTADCLPILLTDTAGSFVAAVHAGWRGLANGIIANVMARVEQAGNSEVLAWLGPAISQQHFAVGDDVRDIFIALSPDNQTAFIPHPLHHNKWLGDIYALATQQLNALAIHHIYGGEYCTYGQSELFHSYRRDGVSGRMASAIWMTS
ncbi:MAG: YfiH family protein [Phenylobacterium sp.]